MSEQLEHLLWRYEYGRLPASQLEAEFRDTLRKLFDARTTQGNPFSAQRWSGQELLVMRDDALRAAAVALDSRRYQEVLRHLRKADEALAAIGSAVEANQRIDRARAAADAVHHLVAGTSLRRMPAIASLTQLSDSMAVCMFNGRHGQASDLAAFCDNIVAALTARHAASVDEQSNAEVRLAALQDLCEATRPFANDEDCDPAADGSLDELRRLLNGEYTALVMRLLGELEVALAARRRFRHHFLRTMDEAMVQALRLQVKERSWDGAVDHDCQTAISLQSAPLERQARLRDE